MKKRYEDDIVPDSSRQIRMEMARQMREARVGGHLTQQVVAERAGTRKSNISRMESGNYNPTLDFLVKVAESMGKQVSICLDDKS
jgi:transcriptional regulator with XRE-family HTH domain